VSSGRSTEVFQTPPIVPKRTRTEAEMEGDQRTFAGGRGPLGDRGGLEMHLSANPVV